MNRIWKKIGGIMVTATVLFAVLLYWTTWTGSSKEIEAVAGQFKPDAGWQQVTNQVVPPRIVCLEANCPSVHRSWKTGNIVAREQLVNLLKKSGWNFEVRGDCLPNQNISGSGMNVCSAEGAHDEYKINVTVVGDYHDSSSAGLTLHVDSNSK